MRALRSPSANFKYKVTALQTRNTDLMCLSAISADQPRCKFSEKETESDLEQL